MSVHEGHRKRLRDRMLKEGLDCFEEHNIIELVLFYSIPRKDTNEIAHELLKTFGSLSGVLDADYSELVKVPGVSENSAALLKCLPMVFRRYMVSRSSATVVLDSKQKAGEYLVSRFMGFKYEVVLLVCMDVKCKLLGCEQIAEGDVTSAHISISRIVQTAFKYNAPCVILAHNHVDGDELPSEDDKITTFEIKKALTPLGIKLLDHLIIAGGEYCSMSEMGMI